MEKIIAENLERMLGNSEGEMQYALINGTMGSLDFYEGKPCMPAHFHYYPDGTIAWFGNPCHATKNQEFDLPHGIYRVSHLFSLISGASREEIVDLLLDEEDSDIRDVLTRSYEEFNQVRNLRKTG